MRWRFIPNIGTGKCKTTTKDNDYYEANKFYRGAVLTQYVKSDPRPPPRPTETIELDPQIRLICPAGGISLCAGAQMLSSVPNISGKTRFSIDFRVVNVDDVAANRGDPVVDEECTGTTLRDFLRVTDLTRIPDDLVALYDDGTGAAGDLLYQPK